MYTPPSSPRTPKTPPSSPRTPKTPPSSPRTPKTPRSLNTEIHNITSDLAGIHWALAGSAAMRAHAKSLGVTSRDPHNLNILIRPNNKMTVYGMLTKSQYTGAPPSRNSKRFTMRRGARNLDVLTAAAFNRNMINGVPVMKLNNLINRKEGIRNNENFHLESERNRTKTLDDIRVLKNLRSRGM